MLAPRLANATGVAHYLRKSAGACLLHRTQHLHWMIVALWDPSTRAFIDVSTRYTPDMEERVQLLWNGPNSPAHRIKTWLADKLAPSALLDLPKEATCLNADATSCNTGGLSFLRTGECKLRASPPRCRR